MKRSVQHIALILLALAAISCEDIITLNLDEATPRIVIEANYDISNEDLSVLISQSNSFYEAAGPQMITGAVVTAGSKYYDSSFPLSEVSPGKYKLFLPHQQADTITLTVTINGKSYMATSVVPVYVKLMEVRSEIRDLPFGQGKTVSLTASWDDPPGSENYYRVQFIRNDTIIKEPIVIVRDKYLDGLNLSVPVPARFSQGDSARITLMTVDRNYYNYFTELTGAGGGGFSTATPFNPVGNFGKEVLGYFGIYYKTEVGLRL